jgi:hypothetical protein
LRGVKHSHLSYLGNGRGWTQNERWYSARGAALGRSNRKIAIHPLSFGRNQFVCQSSSPERAEAWVDKVVQSWQMVFALGTSRFCRSGSTTGVFRCLNAASRCAARRRGPLRPFLRSLRVSVGAVFSVGLQVQVLHLHRRLGVSIHGIHGRRRRVIETVCIQYSEPLRLSANLLMGA